MELLITLGNRLKSLREQAGMTQKETAELLGCTTSHYQKIEYGKVNISVTSLATAAEHFHVSADYLLGRTDQREQGKAIRKVRS